MSLTVTTVERPVAPLGPPGPLPLLAPPPALGTVGAGVPDDIARRAGEGAPASLLPYLAQDDYGRARSSRPVRVAVLENERLAATVALDLGGRVLSLVDRAAGRELLYVNPVVQPANLALRNAWCSGGIEWNIGTRGHSPTTMDTLHAGRVDGPDGGPVLRLWEWERLRGVVFQVDLWLPGDAPVLLARTRIRNVNAAPTPMYWWTNIAVVATAGTRVLAPAERAFRTEYPATLRAVSVPGERDGDLDDTYPARHRHAVDFFYDVAPDQRPWIAAIEADGSGLAQVSTGALRGRKLFAWGTGPGGERWQRWLAADDAGRYAEIQAGLAPTQYEHVTMPAGASWEWTEAFGPVQVDPHRAHAAQWAGAVGEAGAAIDRLVDPRRLDDWHAALGAVADRPPAEVLAVGSGWGALEQRRRRAAGEDRFDDAGTPFPDDSLGPDQAPWRGLLERGALPPREADSPPPSYVIGGDWEARLAAAPAGWLTDYHRAVMAHGAGESDRAAALYESSLRDRPNAWAERGRAELARAAGRRGDAARHAVAAARAAPGEWRLVAEAAGRLLDDDRPAEALALIDGQLAAVRGRGRMRLLEGFAAVGAGQPERARAILEAGLEVADLREGERSIDELWQAAFPGRDVPPEYDFRMT